MFFFMMNVFVFAEDISIDVSTKEELISAVSAINDETGGDHTINITDDIDMDNSSISFRNSTDEKTVTIIGNGRPTKNITRAETAAIFFRLLEPSIRDNNLAYTSVFTDVSADKWYNTEVCTMAKLGIIKGRTSTEFVPEANITRAEFAAICARFDNSDTSGREIFTDLDGHWSKAEVERAAALGWVMGYADDTFLPDKPITRAEAMAMINRVLQRFPEDESDLLSNMNRWPDNTNDKWYYLPVQEATNSHDYITKANSYEKWISLSIDPDWSRY